MMNPARQDWVYFDLNRGECANILPIYLKEIKVIFYCYSCSSSGILQPKNSIVLSFDNARLNQGQNQWSTRPRIFFITFMDFTVSFKIVSVQ